MRIPPICSDSLNSFNNGIEVDNGKLFRGDQDTKISERKVASLKIENITKAFPKSLIKPIREKFLI